MKSKFDHMIAMISIWGIWDWCLTSLIPSEISYELTLNSGESWENWCLPKQRICLTICSLKRSWEGLTLRPIGAMVGLVWIKQDVFHANTANFMADSWRIQDIACILYKYQIRCISYLSIYIYHIIYIYIFTIYIYIHNITYRIRQATIGWNWMLYPYYRRFVRWSIN